jgi:SAM-dependent methyltransferase
MGPSGREIVRRGYEQVAEAYQATRGAGGVEMDLLREFADRLPPVARVLDAGCGSGLPVARFLADERGLDVIGVDFAAAQIALARQNVLNATFIQADMAKLCGPTFPDAGFDGICSFYAIIHVPREEHTSVLKGFWRLLRPGGLLLLSTGYGESDEAVEDDWLGAPMYWSHYGRDENLHMLQDAWFDLIWERAVREDEEFGGGTHLFVLAQKPAG